MRKNTNENGYALIIVLFAIIFITVLTSVFMRGSLSNIKQEHRVDESNLTVTAAEAGVDYYSWEFKKEYQARKSELIKFAEGLEASYNDKKTKPDYPDIQNKTANKLKDILDSKRLSLIGTSNELFGYTHELFLNKAEITIISLTAEDIADKNPMYIIINGKVKGHYNGEYKVDKNLAFQQKFIIPTLEKGDTSGSVEVGQVIDVPSWIERNKPTNECSKSVEAIINDCFADEKNSLGKLKEVYKGAYVYKKGSMVTSGDLDFEKGMMFVSANLDVKKELELEKGSQLFVGGNLIVRNNEEIELEDASYLFVQGNADINGEIEVDNGSYFYVGKNVTITKGLELEGSSGKKNEIKDSTMHVGGNLTFYKEIEMEDNTNLFVAGVLTSDDKKTKIELEGSTKICARDIKLKNTSISMEKNTRIYYFGILDIPKDVLNKHKDKIVKVTNEIDLKNNCSVSTDLPSGGGTSTPPGDGADRWEDPIIESVTY